MPTKTDNEIEVHQAAQFFASRSGAAAVVILTNHPEKLVGQYLPDTNLYIACGQFQLMRSRQSWSELLPNAQFMVDERLDADFLTDKILVCIDYLEAKKASWLSGFHRLRLRGLWSKALLSIVAVEQTNSWSLATLERWTKLNPPRLLGKSKPVFSSKTRNQLISIGGRLVNIRKPRAIPALAIIPVYNEADIVGATIGHLIEQGLDVHVVDNWSKDGSYSVVQKLSTLYPGRISFERFPEKSVEQYQWGRILEKITEIAYEKRHEYKWVMLNDADELRWSPWARVSLQQAFSFIDQLGFNAIDFTVFALEPTTDGFSEKADPDSFFKYGEFPKGSPYFLQVKAWKNTVKGDLASSGGHLVMMPDQRIYPIKFLLAHYSLRSSEQAKRKIFKDRTPRFTREERLKGWNVQYDNVSQDTRFIVQAKGLINYADRDSFEQNYILERLAGIGIKQQPLEDLVKLD